MEKLLKDEQEITTLGRFSLFLLVSGCKQLQGKLKSFKYQIGGCK
ncbi:MAG: hypothetical protein U9N54_11600 [candidate division Zixibacteria bacterium]|nr:hypothetical protein [candidate division Zixibacteria bacterium]